MQRKDRGKNKEVVRSLVLNHFPRARKEGVKGMPQKGAKAAMKKGKG